MWWAQGTNALPGFCPNSRAQGCSPAKVSTWQQWGWWQHRVVPPHTVNTYTSSMIAREISKTKPLLAEILSTVRTCACQNSGVSDILSRHLLNLTDAGTLQMVEEIEAYKRALQDLKPTYKIWEMCLMASKLSSQGQEVFLYETQEGHYKLTRGSPIKIKKGGVFFNRRH